MSIQTNLETFFAENSNGQKITLGLAHCYDYKNTIEDTDGQIIPNPQSKEAFAAEKVVDWLKANYKKYKTDMAVANAKSTANNESDNDLSTL